VDDYCDFFSGKGKRLVFIEHVRSIPSYNVQSFIEKVHSRGHFAGLEAKVLPGGDVDLPSKFINAIDVLAIAVHSFPSCALSDLTNSLKFALNRYNKDIPVVWVHPLSSSIERAIVEDRKRYLNEIIDSFEHLTGIENNIKHHNLSVSEIDYFSKYSPLIVGYDAHSLDEIKNI
jgi:histidinol phosphatase-like PHP family hydrolase